MFNHRVRCLHNHIYKINYSQYKTVLGIETSCDDTAAAIVTTDRRILVERKFNQWSEHRRLGRSRKDSSFGGGVWPELAKKLHSENLIHVVGECVGELTHGWSQIDAIALTTRPGLEICLWEGINFTKQLLKKYQVPLLPIHHMEAHALTSRLFDQRLEFPFLSLLISGGHSIIVLVDDYDKFYRLGESLDISPGNYLDKVARELGLFEMIDDQTINSSGGALVERYASRSSGDLNAYKTVIEAVKNYCGKNKDCNFSFSGLLTANIRLIKKLLESDENLETRILKGVERRVLKEKQIHDLCYLAQHVVSFQLNNRLKRALTYVLNYQQKKLSRVVISGGVASNMFIRSYLEKTIAEFGLRSSHPPAKYCTDNGVMIAWNGCEKLLAGSKDIVMPSEQDDLFFNQTLRPMGKCELGQDLSSNLSFIKIKV